MNIGTKSVLFGVHQFVIHPLTVALAWRQVYGTPLDPRLWLAFMVHDLGYIGCPNMDGPEGERHVELGARIMRRLFGPEWGDFCLYHSRFYAKRDGRHFSRLCVADKLAIAITPAWLYLPLARMSGEIDEYMATHQTRTIAGHDRLDRTAPPPQNAREWLSRLQDYMRRWVAEHQDGRPDTWTSRDAA